MASPSKRPVAQTSITSFFQMPPKKPKLGEEGQKELQDGKKDAVPSNQQGAVASSNATETAAATATDPSSQNAPIIPKNTSFSKHAMWKVYRKACIVRCHRPNPSSSRTKVAGLDLDGTLLVWRSASWPSRFEHYELWNNQVISKLQDLYDNQNYRLVIFSNQGSIRQAFDGKKATLVKTLVEWLAKVVIRRPLEAVLSTSKKNVPNFHKPQPDMWLDAAQNCLNAGQPFDLEHSFFVGDSVLEDATDTQGGVDQAFAKNIGIQFFTPQEFFGPSHAVLRSQKQSLVHYASAPPQAALQARAALVSGIPRKEGPILLILCGAQGSGKSTFCQALVENNKGSDDDDDDKKSAGSKSLWVHLSQDTVGPNGKPGTRQMVEKAAAEALQQGRCVVVDRMHLYATQRSYFVQIAVDMKNVAIHCLVLQPPVQVLASRVEKRVNHVVSGANGAKMAAASSKRLVLPKYDEGFQLISVTAACDTTPWVNLYRRAAASKGLDAEMRIPKSFRLVHAGDVALPALTLGTMGLCDAHTATAKALELGFVAVDTAPTYKNEAKLTLREDTFVTIKVPKRATTAVQVREELQTSLSNMQRKCADLLLLHWPSDVLAAETLAEVWREMEDSVEKGLVKSIGVCNFNVPALCELLAQCTRIRPSVNQVERHPLLPQWELLEFCAQQDIQLQAHSPLGQGKLLEHSVVKQVVESSKKSPAQVLIQWSLLQGVAVVPKCSTEEHMQQVLSATAGTDLLSTQEMEQLNGISDQKRYVAPPFMFGGKAYCWGEKVPK